MHGREVRRQLETNILGLLAVTRAALPTLRAQRKGHIFNVSSVAGFRGDPGGSSYSASKFAVEGISESLASERAPLGIKVTIVEPGYFRTEFLTSGSADFAANVLPDYDSAADQFVPGARVRRRGCVSSRTTTGARIAAVEYSFRRAGTTPRRPEQTSTTILREEA